MSQCTQTIEKTSSTASIESAHSLTAERNHTITESLEHAYQLSINNIVPGTFLRPCDPNNLKLKDDSKSYALRARAVRRFIID